jgi:hypothetical protein
MSEDANAPAPSIRLGRERASTSAGVARVRQPAFSSRMLAAGIPLIEVSAWMGHGLRAGGHEITNITTRVYAHATGESRQAALDELATLIADTDPGHRQRAT